MYASAKWINEYLDPPASADEQAEALTMAGFPLEERIEVELSGGDADVRQDFEMSSNRGDCICHVGLAREIAALTGRSLKLRQPENKATGPVASSIITVTNEEHDRCPLYTGRVIRGVRVGPSPAWLAHRLHAIGQIPRNNIVDATNFVLFELGQPTHVFDLAKMKGHKIIIRMARHGERFLPIGEGEKEVTLTDDDLVIADAEDPVAIGGVKGGALSAVTEKTTDILIEAATFDPVTVRHSSRRHGIESASAYRYERGVAAGQVNPAAERLVELILKVADGELCQGVVSDGAPIPALRTVRMRPARCRAILGVKISDKQMIEYLARLGFAPEPTGRSIACTVPVHRLDIEREIDLIEEVGRLFGHVNIPIADLIAIRVAPLQGREAAKRAVGVALAGMGYVEAVTHSLVSEPAAAPFLREGERLMRVQDDQARAEPVLRPSLMPSLLRVRALNEDRGVKDLKLFEAAATFVDATGGHRERRELGLLVDATDASLELRPLRGAIERLAEILIGPEVDVEVVPDRSVSWLAASCQARVTFDGAEVGHFGLVEGKIRRAFDLETPVAAAALDVDQFFNRYPPEREVRALPAFPSIERDISAVIEEKIRWRDVSRAVDALALDHLETIEFVTVFRGRQIEAGRKSLTLRLRFRAADRTLTHDEVDPQVTRAISSLEQQFSATIRM